MIPNTAVTIERQVQRRRRNVKMARKKNKLELEYVERLIEPVFLVIKCLGGSATNAEIRDEIIETLRLSDEVVDEPHVGKAAQTELEYQLAWARTYLKNYGAIINTERGVWVITPAFADTVAVDGKEVIKTFLEKTGKSGGENGTTQDDDPSNDGVDPPEELEPWRIQIAEILHSMDPFAFERLSQLLLRECGFSQVTVTKKTGDGGIDGRGKLLINGIFSFNVAFQCKRFKGSVGAVEIRNFRGSLTTDREKGIFITTGSFTKAARDEASIAGKQQIDLIDGEEFINKLIEYRIGVKEKAVFEVDKEFFDKV